MIIQNLIKYLNTNTKYCFLRGERALDNLKPVPSDIDILMDENDIKPFLKFCLSQHCYAYPYCKGFGYFLVFFDEKKRKCFKLHIVWKVVYGKTKILNDLFEVSILETRRKKNNLFVPSFKFQALLDSLRLRYDNKNLIWKLDQETKNIIDNQISTYERTTLGEVINFIIVFYNILKSKGRAIIKKRMFSVAVLGVDGAGKSTILNNLVKVFNVNSRIIYMGGNFSILPKLKKHIPIISHLKKLVEIYMRLLLRIFMGSRNKITFFDRYLYDVFARNNISGQIPNLFLKVLYYKPSLVIYLYSSPKEILRRKKELTEEKIVKLDREYKKMVKYDTNFISINNQSIDETVMKITYNILENLNNREITF